MPLIDAGQVSDIFAVGMPVSRDPNRHFTVEVDGSTVLISAGQLTVGLVDAVNLAPGSVTPPALAIDSGDIPHSSPSILATDVEAALEEVALGYLSCLPLAGGVMSGSVDMSGFSVTGLADPVNPSDAVNLASAEGLVYDLRYLSPPTGYAGVSSPNGALQPTWKRATATVLLTANPVPGDTLTVHGVTFTFALAPGPDLIMVGPSPAMTAANAVAAINASVTFTLDGIPFNTEFFAVQGAGLGTEFHLVVLSEDPPNTPETGNTKLLSAISLALVLQSFEGGLGVVPDGMICVDKLSDTAYLYDRMSLTVKWKGLSGGGLIPHAPTHEAPFGTDQINVGGLSGVLADPQDAGSLLGNPVGPAAPSLGDLLTWDGAAWSPAAPGASAAFDRVYNIGPGGVTVLDAVYISGSGQVDRADASDVAKMPAIGFVVSIVGGTCVVRDGGSLGGFVGLTPGASYYVSAAVPGQITAVPPGPGVVNQSCIAVTTTEIRIHIDLDYTEVPA